MTSRFQKITSLVMLAVGIPTLVFGLAYDSIGLNSLGATPTQTNPVVLLQNLQFVFEQLTEPLSATLIAGAGALTLLAIGAIWACRKKR